MSRSMRLYHNTFINLLAMIALMAGFAMTGNTAFAKEKPEIFVQTGHFTIRAVAFSPDGKYALSGSYD